MVTGSTTLGLEACPRQGLNISNYIMGDDC